MKPQCHQTAETPAPVMAAQGLGRIEQLSGVCDYDNSDLRRTVRRGLFLLLPFSPCFPTPIKSTSSNSPSLEFMETMAEEALPTPPHSTGQG